MLVFILLGIFCSVSHVTSGWVPEMENPGIHEGDMVLDPDQMEKVKKGTFTFGSQKDNKMWPNGIIPYRIDSSLANQKEFLDELKVTFEQYHKYTCIKFVKKDRSHRAFITFYRGGGCSSFVGYRGRENRISLSKGCWWRSTIMHEIGHSLGLHHEQSRPDRDDYVTILEHNVASGTQHNFDKERRSDWDPRNTPYDYLSMMHYSWNAFGRNQAMTIKTKDPNMQYEIGQDVGFSQTDIVQLQRMYKCQGTYPTLPPYVPPPKGCYDIGGACGRGAFRGQCVDPRWKTYMHSKCKKSCGLCGTGPRPSGKPMTFPPYTQPPTRSTTKGTGGGDCKDRVIDCRRLGRHRCNDANRAWREYMVRSCKKYCNLC